MNRLWVILIVLAVMAIGWLSLVLDRLKLLDRRTFVDEYLNKFQQLARAYRNNSFDDEVYTWLTYRVIKIQRELGILGICDYRPPFANYIHHGYQLIANTLPEMRTGMAHGATISGCEEELIRYLGLLDELLQDSWRNLRNPFKWLQAGIRFVVSMPIRTLHWSGLIGEASLNIVTGNILFRGLSGLVTLIYVVASIISIVVGWERFIKLVRNLRKKPSRKVLRELTSI